MYKSVIYKRNQYIAKKGEVGNYLYIITTGKIAITHFHNGEEIVKGYLSVGEVFGVHYLFSKYILKFNLKAITNVEMLVVPIEVLEKNIESLPDWAITLLKSATSNLQRTIEFVEKLNIDGK